MGGHCLWVALPVHLLSQIVGSLCIANAAGQQLLVLTSYSSHSLPDISDTVGEVLFVC